MKSRIINFFRNKKSETQNQLQVLGKKTKLFFIELTHWKLVKEIKPLLKKQQGIQLEVNEILSIVKAVRKFPACRFLVFGIGNDSVFWKDINRAGRTAFLEDHDQWFKETLAKHPHLEAHLVKYPCNITQWREMLEQPEKLSFQIPTAVQEKKWDVVLVDGPMGHEMDAQVPGRMSSILAASRLVADEGLVFVHDAERNVEAAYCEKYLRNENLVERTVGRALLSQYRMKQRMMGGQS